MSKGVVAGLLGILAGSVVVSAAAADKVVLQCTGRTVVENANFVGLQSAFTGEFAVTGKAVEMLVGQSKGFSDIYLRDPLVTDKRRPTYLSAAGDKLVIEDGWRVQIYSTRVEPAPERKVHRRTQTYCKDVTG